MIRLHILGCLLFLSVTGAGLGQVDRKPRVLAVYPAADDIPANVLRFYVQFSRPMREGDAIAGIRVMDAEGRAVDSVFFDNNDELWNGDRTMLTLLVDPGRVKTGLVANRRMGLAFQLGRRYILSVTTRFRAISGDTLLVPFHKLFSVVAPRLTVPGPDAWVVDFPRAESRDSLIIHFRVAMDHLSAAGSLLVMQKGNAVAGQAVLSCHDSEWLFRPERPWSRSSYRLAINRRLEDIAGNNLYGPFERESGAGEKEEGQIINKQFFIN